METKKWKARKYHNFVWKTAKQDTESYFYSDFRNWIGNIISGIGSAVIIPYILDIWKGGEMTLPFLYQVILALFSGVFGFAVFVVGLYLYNGVWLVPAKLYRKKESQATLPSWEDIEVKEFEFPPTSGFGVGLEIISHKPEIEYMGNVNDPYIQDVVPKLSRISKDGVVQNFPLDNYSSALPIVQGGTTFERFSHIQSIKDLRRDKRKHNAISIAKYDSERAWITLGTVSNEKIVYLDCGKTHSIEIEIRDARVSPLDVTMNYFGIKCDLLYDTWEDGKKRVSIKVISRYPEYEKY